MSYESDKEFQRCVQFILEQECRRKKDGTLDDGYVVDSGGETKYGISKRAYPNIDIKQLSIGDALGIYYRDYWYLAKSLKFPMNLCVFDCAVNQGTKKAAQFLLAAKDDWKLYLFQREQHYLAILDGKFRNDPNRFKYKKSWFNRINKLKKYIDTELQK